MGLHERAWSGLGLLIYGKKPLLPMQLEEAIGAANPNNEIRIDSFEEYDDALDFCKTKQNVGFIFLLENCEKLSAHDVFLQLARTYETKGWPCFGVLIHEGVETLSGLRIMQRCPELIDYIPSADILDTTKTANTVNNIWNSFIKAFEKNIIPTPLQDTLLSLAKTTATQESLHFMDRVSTLLSTNLNISWIDSIAIRWNPIVSIVENISKAALTPHNTFMQICQLASFDSKLKDISSITASTIPLCARVCAMATFLDENRKKGSLTEVLQTAGTLSKPGAPALIRHLVLARDKILEIAHEEEKQNSLEKFG